MTKDAQNALRRVMEKFTENTRFCLICNYLTKVSQTILTPITDFATTFELIVILNIKQILINISNAILTPSL